MKRFGHWKPKIVKEEIIISCSYCPDPSVANFGKIYYCKDNKCATKWLEGQEVKKEADKNLNE